MADDAPIKGIEVPSNAYAFVEIWVAKFLAANS
jgi:hypothetical protein